MTARRPLLVVTAGCVTATALGLVLGHGGTVALASALAFATALAVAAALQLRPARGKGPPPPARGDKIPVRLRQIAKDLQACERSEVGIDRSLRPLLAPIAAARLGRRGVDMALAPQRAHELLGDLLWDIVRPDRPSAAYRVGHGLAPDDLRTAIERLEQL
ncbi:MAG: hypothetical protein ACRC50_01890 [Gaiella sp.]